MLERATAVVMGTLRAARELPPLTATERAAYDVSIRGIAAAPSQPIVLIPGFTNDASKLAKLARTLQHAGHRPYVLEQPERGMVSIAQSADDLARVVAAVRAEHGADRIWLVGFSRGGLVARAHLQGSADALAGSAGLVTIGTPHLGVARAGVVSAVVGARLAPEGIRSRIAPLVSSAMGDAVDRAASGIWRAASAASASMSNPATPAGAAVEAADELVRDSAVIRSLGAGLDDVIAGAHAATPDWRLVAVHGRVPGAASDGVVSVRSATLDGAHPYFVRPVEITGSDARHAELPEHPQTAATVLRAISGAFA